MKAVNQALSLSRWQTWQRQLPEEQLVNHTGGGASITDGRKGDIKIIIMRKQSGLPAPIWGCYFSSNLQEPPRSHVSIRSCLTRISVLTAWADRLPVRGWADCRLVCGIYWGSQTEGPPNESSTAFQPAPSPASASCKKGKKKKTGGEINSGTKSRGAIYVDWAGVVEEVRVGWCFYRKIVTVGLDLSSLHSVASFWFHFSYKINNKSPSEARWCVDSRSCFEA